MPRPPRYHDEQHRVEARRKQIRESVRRYRRRKKEAEANVPSPTAPSSAATGPPTLSTIGHDEDPIEEIIREPQDSDQVLFETPLHKVGVIWNAQEQNVEISWRMPPELFMNYSHLTVASLLTDYARVANVRDDWWEHMGPNDCSPTTRHLAIRATVCSCAMALGTMLQNQALLRIGDASYHDTVKILRRLIALNHMARYGVTLVLMARHLAVHDLGFVLQQVAAPQNAWMEHILAINAIIEQTGPASFTRALGAEILQAHLSAMLMIAFKDRKASIVTSSSAWMECLNSIAVHTKLYKDRVWPLAFGIPALMEAFDNLAEGVRNNPSREQARALSTLYERIIGLDQRLDEWNSPFVTPDDEISDSITRTGKGSMLDTLQSPIHFVTQESAQCKTMYWGLKIAISVLRTDVRILLEQVDRRAITPPTTTTCFLLPELNDACHYAHLLARTFQWWGNSSTADTSTVYSFCTFPQRIAWRWATCQKGASFDEIKLAFIGHSTSVRSSGFAGRLSEGIVDLLYWTPPVLDKQE